MHLMRSQTIDLTRSGDPLVSAVPCPACVQTSSLFSFLVNEVTSCLLSEEDKQLIVGAWPLSALIVFNFRTRRGNGADRTGSERFTV